MLEKKAIIGALGSMAGGFASMAARTAIKHPGAALTGTALAIGATGEYKKNMSKFREASGNVITPPGVH